MFPQVTPTRPITEDSFVAQSIFLEVALLRGTSRKEEKKQTKREKDENKQGLQIEE